MTKNNFYVLPLLLIFAVIFTVGCKDKFGGSFPMTIKVTQSGTPVEGAIVALYGVSDGKTATGVTDAKGIATIKSTDGGWQGVFPGEYTVTIKKTETTISSTPPPGTEVDRNSTEENAFTVSRELLPAQYGNARTSDLKVTQEAKKGTFEFDLPAN